MKFMNIETDQWPCSGRRFWFRLPVVRNFDGDPYLVGWSRHRWVATSADTSGLLAEGQSLYTLHVTCSCCGLQDQVLGVRLAEILLSKIKLTDDTRRQLGIHVRQVIDLRTGVITHGGNSLGKSEAADAAGEALAITGGLQPRILRPSRIAAAVRFLGRSLFGLSYFCTGPIRWPIAVLNGWFVRVGKTPWRWLGVPTLVLIGLSGLGMTPVLISWGIDHETKQCATPKYSGTVTSITPLEDNKLALQFDGGPGYKVHMSSGEALPAVGVAGYVCENDHFHLPKPRLEPEPKLEGGAEDF